MNEMPLPDDAVPEDAYEPPAVITLGTLADLTRGNAGVPIDGFGGSAPV
jgi:hypothetical protein